MRKMVFVGSVAMMLLVNVFGAFASEYIRKDGSKLTLTNMCTGVLANAGHIEKLAERIDRHNSDSGDSFTSIKTTKKIDLDISVSNKDNRITFIINIRSGNLHELFYEISKDMDGQESNDRHFGLNKYHAIDIMFDVQGWFYGEYKDTNYYYDLLNMDAVYALNYTTRNGSIQFQGFQEHLKYNLYAGSINVPICFIKCGPYEVKETLSDDIRNYWYGYIDKPWPHFDRVKQAWNAAYFVAYLFEDYAQILGIPVPPGLDTTLENDYNALKAAVKAKQTDSIISYVNKLGLRLSDVMNKADIDALLLSMIKGNYGIDKFDVFKKEKNIVFSSEERSELCKHQKLLDAFFDKPLGKSKYDQFGSDYLDGFGKILLETRDKELLSLLVKRGVFSETKSTALQAYYAIKDGNSDGVKKIMENSNSSISQIAFTHIPGANTTVIYSILDANDPALINYAISDLNITATLEAIVFMSEHPTDKDNIAILLTLPECQKQIVFYPHLKTIDASFNTIIGIKDSSSVEWNDVSIESFEDKAASSAPFYSNIYKLYRDKMFDFVYSFASNFDPEEFLDSGHLRESYEYESTVVYHLPMSFDEKSGLQFDVSISNTSGETLLMTAARWNKIDFAKELLKKGADAKAKNKDGQTALDIAAEAGNKKIVSLLKKYK